MEYQKDGTDSLIIVRAACVRDHDSFYQVLSGHPHLDLSSNSGLPYLPSDCAGDFVKATL